MKYIRILLKGISVIVVLTLLVILSNEKSKFAIRDITQANLSQGLRTVKITEEKIRIDDKNISISVKMPEVHCSKTEVERYINTYIRRNINEFINHQRQAIEINNNSEKKYISINYNVAFEDRNLLNIIIYRNIKKDKNKFTLEKDSYLFDLETGQRIYLDNFLKNNSDYQEVIAKYIYNYAKKHNLRIDKDRIIINKYTNFIIADGGMIIYFNPYKQNNSKINYEFKIPSQIFKNKIKIVGTNNIVANIDTQTITKDGKYINSVINIPIIITSNKKIEKCINDKIRNDIMDFYNNSQEEAKNYLSKFPDVENKFVANVDFEVKKNSDNILSINVRYYKYSGGAHGYYEDISYNIDMRNGKVLMLSDLFKENSDYKKVIDDEIRRQIEKIVKNDKEYEGVYQFNGIKLNNKFYIQDDNLVIYFDLYEIAPYAAGQPEFSINISTISHMLKDEYREMFK
ncbi:DUF3298 domain-containing protein [Romboutsia sp.]|uniref:DUF3298 domain-containing protein n=1 Tax=Romboutsia sp. TaxID=1965302 RepID=UPI002C009D21|nr:DUF3298 domain-containing protein [Romboutsia sp.]HSQ88932.1 DUF3298 domain-containing protein [Romboutsia sp.]